MTSRQGRLLFLLVLIACVSCDQATKGVADAHLMGQPAVRLWHGTVELVHTRNPGAFLSLGAELPTLLRTLLFGVGVTAVMLWLARAVLTARTMSGVRIVAAGLLIGGGAGNLIDRMFLGSVRDFAVVHLGPLHTGIFNAADVAVMAGVLGLLLLEWRAPRRRMDQRIT